MHERSNWFCSSMRGLLIYHSNVLLYYAFDSKDSLVNNSWRHIWCMCKSELWGSMCWQCRTTTCLYVNIHVITVLRMVPSHLPLLWAIIDNSINVPFHWHFPVLPWPTFLLCDLFPLEFPLFLSFIFTSRFPFSRHYPPYHVPSTHSHLFPPRLHN